MHRELLKHARSIWAFITVCMLIYSVKRMNLQHAVCRVGDALRHADRASQDMPVLMLARSQSLYLYRDRRASSPAWSVPYQWPHGLEGDTLLFIKPRGCAALQQRLQLSQPMLRAAVCALLQGAFRSTRTSIRDCVSDNSNWLSDDILCTA